MIETHNIKKILNEMSATGLNNLLIEINAAETNIEKMILSKLHNNIKIIANIINNANKEGAKKIEVAMIRLKYPNILFEGVFKEFYEEINNQYFNFSNIIKFYSIEKKKIDPKFKQEIMDTFLDALKNKTIQPTDVYAYVEILKQSEEGKEIIKKYSKEIIQITNEPMKTLKILKEVNVNMEEINKIANTRIDAVADEILKANGIEIPEDKSLQEQRKDLKETITMMLEDILKNENCNVCDIRKEGEGSFSKTYRINTKIFKIGTHPAIYEVPRDSKRFLKHIIRYNHPKEISGKSISISVYELCDTTKQITREELYEVYKDIRDEGMVWSDARKENVGKLLKDNEIHFNRIEKVYYKNLGFEKDKKVETLKKGEWVVFDLDFIYPANAKDILWVTTSYSQQFEKRYKIELTKRKNQMLNSAIQATKKSVSKKDIKGVIKNLIIVAKLKKDRRRSKDSNTERE